MVRVIGRRRARILSFNEVAARMDRYWAVISGLAERALAHYKRTVVASLAQPSGRTRASFIHDYMIGELRRAHGDRVVQQRGRWLLRVDQDLLMQFKKLGTDGRPRNYPTRGALAFQTQLELPGLPTGMRVTYGYRLSKDNTEVVEESLVAVDGDRVIWRNDIRVNQSVLPIQATPSPAQQRKRFAPKKEALEARGISDTDADVDEDKKKTTKPGE